MAPSSKPARFLLIFAATRAEAALIAKRHKIEKGLWEHVTEPRHLELRHPSKLDVHTCPGYHVDHPEYLQLHKDLMARFKVYGISRAYA